jgi:hypothetical protein
MRPRRRSRPAQSCPACRDIDGRRAKG